MNSNIFTFDSINFPAIIYLFHDVSGHVNIINEDDTVDWIYRRGITMITL